MDKVLEGNAAKIEEMNRQKVPIKIDEIHKRKVPIKIEVPEINLDTTTKKIVSIPNSPKLTRPSSPRWSCLCSPTTHVGSFRCRMHRGHGVGMVRGGSIGSKLSALAAKSDYKL